MNEVVLDLGALPIGMYTKVTSYIWEHRIPHNIIDFVSPSSTEEWPGEIELTEEDAMILILRFGFLIYTKRI